MPCTSAHPLKHSQMPFAERQSPLSQPSAHSRDAMPQSAGQLPSTPSAVRSPSSQMELPQTPLRVGVGTSASTTEEFFGWLGTKMPSWASTQAELNSAAPVLALPALGIAFTLANRGTAAGKEGGGGRLCVFVLYVCVAFLRVVCPRPACLSHLVRPGGPPAAPAPGEGCAHGSGAFAPCLLGRSSCPPL